MFADADMLSDFLWVRSQDFFGQRLTQAWASNGDLVQNALEQAAGSADLISVRGRASFTRPFERVEKLRRAANTCRQGAGARATAARHRGKAHRAAGEGRRKAGVGARRTRTYVVISIGFNSAMPDPATGTGCSGDVGTTDASYAGWLLTTDDTCLQAGVVAHENRLDHLGGVGCAGQTHAARRLERL